MGLLNPLEAAHPSPSWDPRQKAHSSAPPLIVCRRPEHGCSSLQSFASRPGRAPQRLPCPQRTGPHVPRGGHRNGSTCSPRRPPGARHDASTPTCSLPRASSSQTTGWVRQRQGQHGKRTLQALRWMKVEVKGCSFACIDGGATNRQSDPFCSVPPLLSWARAGH